MVFAVRLTWSAKHVARLQREGGAAEASQTVLRLARRMRIDRLVRVLMSSLVHSPTAPLSFLDSALASVTLTSPRPNRSHSLTILIAEKL